MAKQLLVVIEAWAMMLKSLGDDGLWARATHMSDRTECIRALNEIFGFNPLRYTTTMFRVQSATTVRFPFPFLFFTPISDD